MSKITTIAGINTVLTLLQKNVSIFQEIYLSNDNNNSRLKEIVDLANENNIKIIYLNKENLNKKTNINHQGVIANILQTGFSNENIIDNILAVKENALFLLLDGITDVHNFGACLRSAECFGVDCVIVPKDNSAPLNETVYKVACGAAEIVPIVATTNLVRLMKKMQDKGVWFVGTSDKANTTIFKQDLKGNLAIVMGNEGKGMRELTQKTCDFLVSIPMQGVVSSLNVNVATGICLFEVQRQRLN